MNTKISPAIIPSRAKKHEKIARSYIDELMKKSASVEIMSKNNAELQSRNLELTIECNSLRAINTQLMISNRLLADEYARIELENDLLSGSK